jgi:hypothetical protein
MPSMVLKNGGSQELRSVNSLIRQLVRCLVKLLKSFPPLCKTHWKCAYFLLKKIKNYAVKTIAFANDITALLL